MSESLECRVPKTRRRAYSPRDYAEEWVFLTSAGVRADQIIERSRPSRYWFNSRVLPLVTKSLCATCGEAFNPQDAGTLLRCAKNCGFLPTRQAVDLITY